MIIKHSIEEKQTYLSLADERLINFRAQVMGSSKMSTQGPNLFGKDERSKEERGENETFSFASSG